MTSVILPVALVPSDVADSSVVEILVVDNIVDGSTDAVLCVVATISVVTCFVVNDGVVFTVVSLMRVVVGNEVVTSNIDNSAVVRLVVCGVALESPDGALVVVPASFVVADGVVVVTDDVSITSFVVNTCSAVEAIDVVTSVVLPVVVVAVVSSDVEDSPVVKMLVIDDIVNDSIDAVLCVGSAISVLTCFVVNDGVVSTVVSLMRVVVGSGVVPSVVLAFVAVTSNVDESAVLGGCVVEVSDVVSLASFVVNTCCVLGAIEVVMSVALDNSVVVILMVSSDVGYCKVVVSFASFVVGATEVVTSYVPLVFVVPASLVEYPSVVDNLLDGAIDLIMGCVVCAALVVLG